MKVLDTKTDIVIRIALTFIWVVGVLFFFLVALGEFAEWQPDKVMTTQDYSAMVKEGRNQ